jgi:O-antigen biosynthesis protein
MGPAKALFVAGMHRSGTSACAGVLQRLGYDLGRELMEAGADNERGYYENSRVYRFHEAVLHDLGTTWDGLSPWPADWLRAAALKGRREELAEILHSEFTSGHPLAVKDPRLCRLWPLWREVLEGADLAHGLIVPLRNPLEVVLSLERRNGFSRPKSLLLWLDHCLAIESCTRSTPRAFFLFRDLLDRPEATLARLARTLDTEWPPDGAPGRDDIPRFLDRGLVHHRQPDPDLEAALDPPVAALYRSLLELTVGDGPGAPAREAIDRLRGEFGAQRALFFGPEIAGLYRDKEGALRRLEEASRTIVVLEGRLREAESRAQDLDRQILGLVRSKSWRLCAPARALRGLWARSAWRSRMGAFELTRAVVRRLPLSPQTKARLKSAARALRGRRGRLWSRQSPGGRAETMAAGPGSVSAPPAWTDPRPQFGRTLETLDRPDFGFTAPAKPEISIIIPARDMIEFTFNCLRSVSEAAPSAWSYEVLVVDDGSTDRTPEVLARIEGLRTIRNETSRGFSQSCNRAAGEARGDYLVFLNNDALVRPGWLDWLRRTFEDYPEAGLAGSKFLFPEGLLQEAGGLIWRDGTASHYGRMDDPRRPEYGYLRETDYCSGASLMVPRDLFSRVGGFEPLYQPAYYEDADLAFKVRAAGRKVFYQPNSEVVHFEGISHAADIRGGLKGLQDTNRRRFADKWRTALANHAEEGRDPEGERDRWVGRRLLIIDECVCLPDQDAGSLRMASMVRIAQDLGFQVTFYPDNQALLEPYATDMRGRGVEVLAGPAWQGLGPHLRSCGPRYDIVLLSRLGPARRSIGAVRRHCRGALVVFDTVDLHFLREEREAALKADPGLKRAALRTRKAELQTAAQAHLTLAVSRAEKQILEKAVPHLRAAVLSMIHTPVGNDVPFCGRRGFLFVGGFRYSPNIDAALYLVGEILPLIRQRLSGFTLHIVGALPPPEIRALAADDVLVAGHCPDLEPYLRGCRVSLAPLRWGAGVKGKITLSLSRGLPVAATAMAVEGMELTSGLDVLASDDAEGFATAAADLYADEALWTRLSVAGLDYVRRQHSVETAARTMASFMLPDEDAARPRAGGGHGR